MKIYDRYNNVRVKQAYNLSNEVVTVQDQSETIQSILERLSRGVDSGVFERRPLELEDEDVAMQLDYADELDARNMQLDYAYELDARNKQLELQQRQEANKVTPVSHATATEATSPNEVGRVAGSAPTKEQGASEASKRNEVERAK